MQKMHQLPGRLSGRIWIGKFVLSDTNGRCEVIFRPLHVPLPPAGPRRFVQGPDIGKLVDRQGWPLLGDFGQMCQRFFKQRRSSVAIAKPVTRPAKATQ